MNGMAILNDRVRKICVHFSLMVVKPPGYNGDAVRISFHRPPFPELAEQAPPHEIASAALQQKQQQKEEQKEATADATADAAHAPEPAPNPKQELTPTAI